MSRRCSKARWEQGSIIDGHFQRQIQKTRVTCIFALLSSQSEGINPSVWFDRYWFLGLTALEYLDMFTLHRGRGERRP